jgi:cytochrome oxidase assembly protein ShyY1
VYRFLLAPRWLGFLALTLVASAVMVMLGNWQLSRYHERSAINARIDTAAKLPPVPVAQALPAPAGTAGTAGQAPPANAAWTRVTVTGRYDSANVILVRNRTVNGQVGFEAVVPLLLPDQTAVLVDRGWIPPAPGGAIAMPQVPATPTEQVTVVGRVHLSESQPDQVTRRDGRIETRRVSVPRLAGQLPYPVYGAYLLLDQQTPPADPVFSAIPVVYENSWQNAGYVVQWWMFAVMALVGFGWAARREAHGGADEGTARQDLAADPAATSPA